MRFVNLRHILKGPKAAPFYSQFVSETRARKNAWRAIFSYFILFYFILFYFVSFHFISFHFISFHFILFYFILFYSSTSSLSESDYVHHVFSVVPALLALGGSLMVLFFRPPSCRTKRGWYGFKASHAIMSYHQLSWLRCSLCTIIFNKHNQYEKNHLWTLIMSMQFVNEIMIEFHLLCQAALYGLFYISLS